VASLLLVHGFMQTQSREPLTLPLAHRRCVPLSRDEEDALTREYAQTRSHAVAQRLVEANLRLVVRIASEYRVPAHTEFGDLVQEGAAGLARAVERFDPGRGVRLTSYAGWWIRACILEHINSTCRMMRLGRSREDRQAMRRGELPPMMLSLDTPLRDTASFTLLDTLEAPDEERPDHATERTELDTVVLRAAEQFAHGLDAREDAIFRGRLLCREPELLSRLARRFGVSCERIRQIEKELIARLRRHLGGAIGDVAAVC
jgi:RNA polymerase sigma-32 factor